MATSDPAPDLTDDAALGGVLQLWQPRRGHRFGHDGVLLAAAAAVSPGDHVVDLGAGVGVAGLALCARFADITVTLIEREPALAALAAENLRRNGFAARGRALALDVTAPPRAFAAAGLAAGCAQRVIANPPFNEAARHRSSPDAARRRAHMATGGDLAAWCRTALRLLAPGGWLTLVWRADGLPEMLCALDRGFGSAAIMPVHPRPEAAAIRILVTARKGARAALRLLPPLMLHDAAGRPSSEAEAVLRHGQGLALL